MDAARKRKNAEYNKAYRQKDYEAKKEKDRLRKKKKRDFIKVNDPEKYDEVKKAEKKRKKKCWERKKAENSNVASSQSSFLTAQARVNRINFQVNLLPKDEAMRKEIFLGMGKKLGFNVEPLPQAKSSKGLYPTVDQLRPKRFVKLRTKTPRNTCVCSIHANMKFALKALARADPTYKDVVIGSDMSKNFICVGDKETCFSNKCYKCKHSPAFFEKFQENAENATKSVKWEQWQKAPDGGIFSQVEKFTKTGTESDLIKHIKEMKVKFLLHVLVKRNQADCLELYCLQAKSKNATTAVLQVDWARNYRCFLQDSTQAIYSNKKEVSIFTAMMWHRGEKSMAVALDSGDHSKKTVVPCLDKLFKEIPTTASTVHIFSDNSPSQFKNKYTMALIPALQKEHGKKIIWHYLAAQHGKGATDGIGGGLKLAATNKSKGGETILDAEAFVAAISPHSKVALKLITDDEIKKINADIGLEYICSNNPLKIKNILKYHCFKVDFEKVEYQKLSSFDQEEQDDLIHDEEEDDILMVEKEENVSFKEEEEDDDDSEGVLANNFHDYGPWSQFKHKLRTRLDPLLLDPLLLDPLLLDPLLLDPLIIKY
ncbi:CLUMA_CG007999, isoform A [Clunio marinus]|uniref:CLUMA_CG007999, isoform A n=1 Tax=Clunio marinus TaxID=568069 RepID=A0A1J1I2I5_9DIPT|nr:CLUMA_CG007999, isoform A [Clunio marinus]